ncbi:MAG TPA: helix-turn-helix transcriptional regulator [Chloroflexota bacterium]|nr:helix-turn-helix transcriptional regulator [Chloroflexota bacterium]
MVTQSRRGSASQVGLLLQQWRRIRRKSQLALALDADVSPRHLSFVESGRSNPSREMVLILANALDVPLRERNDLLLAAGYAPIYRQTGLAAPEMRQARRALDCLLRQQEPYPAVVMDRHWNLLMTNEAGTRFFESLIDLTAVPGQANVMRTMLHPDGVRPFIVNWEAVAEALVQRVHREAIGGVPDEETRLLLAEILAYPDMPRRWRTPNLTTASPPFLAVQFRKGDLALSYFSTVTTLGTPQDITLQELRIESFFPADEATEIHARRLAREWAGATSSPDGDRALSGSLLVRT